MTGYWKWLWNIIKNIQLSTYLRTIVRKLIRPDLEVFYGILVWSFGWIPLVFIHTYLSPISFVVGFLLFTHGIYRDK